MSIKLEHVSYIYEKGTPMAVEGLRDVSLEIRQGTFTGLIGHTGSGKSTLIQHLNGLLKPTEGKVFFHGEDIFAEKYDRRALRGRVGLVFQYPEHQLFETDVFADVCFGPKNQKLPQEEIERRAKDALSAVGLGEEYYARSPFELSGGEKRRAAIAGVLAMEPEILVLDEPTAGLDPRGREELLELLKHLQEEKGLGIVLVSHSMEDVARTADYLYVMDEGRLKLEGSPREVFRRREELEAMGLAVPQVTRIMQRLREKGLPVETDVLTVEEACAILTEVLQ